MKESINKKVIDEFLEYILSKNYSELTCNSYKKDLYELDEFYCFNKNFVKLNTVDIKIYIESLFSKNNTSTSIRRKISTLKSFYKYLSSFTNNFINPMKKICYPKKEKRLPNFVYYNDFLTILETAKTDKLGLRDALIIEFIFDTGVRVSELVSIKIPDLNPKKKEVKILGKGNKERIIYFGDYASELLNEYLVFRTSIGKSKTHNYLFVNKNGMPLTDRGVRLIFSNIMKKLYIKTKVSPHTLRHSFATSMLNEGADIRVVQELLGHESLETTEIYTHITDDSLKETYLHTHPRSKEKEVRNE